MMRNISTFLLLVQVALLFAACSSEPLSDSGSKTSFQPAATAVVERARLPRLHEAVGTVKARTDVRVEAQITGRVREVRVRPGEQVAKGDTLVILDSRASEVQLSRSKQALQTTASLTAQAKDFLAAARADFDKMKSTYRRMKQLNDQNVVTLEEVEKAESAYLQAQARLGQAEEGLAAARARQGEATEVVQEANITLGYTSILAQEDGEVARRLAEPGDLAFPGKELLTLQTGASLRLEAMVRESLIGQVRIGDMLEVVVSALESDALIEATVDEIEPLADPVTRSFLVKARLPEVPGLFPGMFGRLRIPQGERDVVLVPEEAITRVGQLETVLVKTADAWETIYIRTGMRHGEMVEVLSGLSGGETVGFGVKTEAK